MVDVILEPYTRKYGVKLVHDGDADMYMKGLMDTHGLFNMYSTACMR